jgi:Flp pilus assembly protein TadG
VAFPMLPVVGRLALDESGQNLIELALLLPVLLLIVFGTIQFGLVLNAYVTLNNAVREGAREASLYFFDFNLSAEQNERARLQRLEDQLLAAQGVLALGSSRSTGTANFSHSGSFSGNCPWRTTTACTVTDGDISVTYSVPSGVTPNVARRGYELAIQAHYHEPVFIPLISSLLPADPTKGSGWFSVPAQITVVIN